MFDKPITYYIALGTGALIVVDRHKGKPFRSRALIAAISAGIGHSTAPDIAAYLGRSETLAVMIMTALGYLIMDGLWALFSDREWLKEFIRAKIGEGSDMRHTREAMDRNRGLVLVIAVLFVVWLLEPTTAVMFETCFDILQHIGGAR